MATPTKMTTYGFMCFCARIAHGCPQSDWVSWVGAQESKNVQACPSICEQWASPKRLGTHHSVFAGQRGLHGSPCRLSCRTCTTYLTLAMPHQESKNPKTALCNKSKPRGFKFAWVLLNSLMSEITILRLWHCSIPALHAQLSMLSWPAVCLVEKNRLYKHLARRKPFHIRVYQSSCTRRWRKFQRWEAYKRGKMLPCVDGSANWWTEMWLRLWVSLSLSI